MPQVAVGNPLAEALRLLGLNLPQPQGPSVPLPDEPGDPGYDPTTLANRVADPSVVDPAWLRVLRAGMNTAGRLGEGVKGMVTGGNEQPGASAENFGAIIAALGPLLGMARMIPPSASPVVDIAAGKITSGFHTGIRNGLKRLGIPEMDAIGVGLGQLDPMSVPSIINKLDVLPIDAADIVSNVRNLQRYGDEFGGASERLGRQVVNAIAQHANKQPSRWVDVGSNYSPSDVAENMVDQFIKGNRIDVPELAKGWRDTFLEIINNLAMPKSTP